MGNFNAICHHHKKEGGRRKSQQQMDEFNERISFTWKIWGRRDQGLCGSISDESL